MNKPLYQQYADAAPVGVYTMSNWGGLVILDIDECQEIAVCAFSWGDTGYQKIRRHKIHFSGSGRAYIRKNGTRFYFDQIMRAAV